MKTICASSLLVMTLIFSCKNSSGDIKLNLPTEAENVDKIMYQAAFNASGNKWYNNSTDTLTSAPQSPHPFGKLRVRYNAEASKFIDANGKVISGTIFSTGSIIVKELFDANGALAEYAVMAKDESSQYADSYGWLWALYKPNGEVKSSGSSNGDGVNCTGCHAGISGQIDLTTMNATQP